MFLISIKLEKYTIENTVKRINNSKTAMIGMKPKDAIKLSNVELVKSEEFADEKPLPEDELYQYVCT